MSRVYYGAGNCTIKSKSDVFGLEIVYDGKIRIIDKTSDNYYIMSSNKKIIIFPTGEVEPLTNLFDYIGKLKIKSIIGSDINGKFIPVNIKRMLDYSELLEIKSEDMEIKSESINARYSHGREIKNTTVDNKVIKNQYSDGGKFYLEDGSPYTGAYHIHLETSRAMTGYEHTVESRKLYTLSYRKKRPTKRQPVKKTVRRITSKTRGKGGGSMGGGGGY